MNNKQIRIEPVDTWRAFAALGVVWIHCWSHFGNPSLQVAGINLYKLIAVVGNGVDFFFVISGFCLYMVWINKPINQQTYITFIKKRWLRIAPAFYVAAIIIALYNFIFLKLPIILPLIGNFLFIQNLNSKFNISAPFWSLAVEFHFYILLPLFLLFSNKNFVRTVILVFIFGSILIGSFSTLDYNYHLLTKVNHFLIGIVIAWIYFQKKEYLKYFSKLSLFFLAIVLLFVGRFLLSDAYSGDKAPHHILFKILGSNLLVIGFALVMLITMVNKWLIKIFSNKLGLFFGKLSYSIYLWHSFVIMLVSKKIVPYLGNSSLNPIILFVIVTLILVPISYLSYELLEKIYFKKAKAKL